MDTDGIRLFVLAAKKLNISAAGSELGMAPAVASAKLAKLERSIGADLLHRSTRKVTLSSKGSDFLPYAKEIVEQEDTALAIMGISNAEPTGTLRFAASSTFAQLYVMPLIPEFLERYPGINLDMRLTDTQFDLITGSFDLALRNSTLIDSGLRARKLADDTRILCASPAYLNTFGTPLELEDLASHRIIGFKDQLPKRMIGKQGDAGFFAPGNMDCRLIIDDGLSQKIATMAGVGISNNSMWCVHNELRDGTLIRVLPEYTLDDETSLWLVYPKSNVLTDKVRLFIDFLVEHIRKPLAVL